MHLNYFEPISDNVKNHIDNLSDYQIGKNITYHNSVFPAIENHDIVLIGIGNTTANFRTYFYQLSYDFNQIKIADLGNLNSNHVDKLPEIVAYYKTKNVLPIIISSSNELLNLLPKQIDNNLTNLIVIDKVFSISFDDKKNNNSINATLLDTNNISNMGLIAHQSYFMDSKTLDYLSKKNYDYLRLGILKGNIELSEPIIRDADFMSFNLAALKKIEVPSCSQASPSGLFVEEACQLTYYAGISDKMQLCNIHGYDIKDKDENQTAQALSQMVWYFIFGYYNRKHDYPVSMNNFRAFIINFKASNYQITFWKSIKSDRWWMEIPVKEQSQTRHKLIPCSYEDYLEAGNGNLPERLLNAYQRFE